MPLILMASSTIHISNDNLCLCFFFNYVIDKKIRMPLLQDDDEELGDLWQDENNMAALLLYKQRGRNQYSLVS